MSAIVYLGILLISITIIYFSKKLLGVLGLKIAFILMTMLSFFLTFKYTTLSTINLNANSITYVSMFTTLYLLLESIDKKEVKKVTNLNFLISIFISVMVFLMSYHTQSLTDSIGINMKNVFINNYRILFIYPLTTLISNYLLIWMYEKIRKLYDIPFITTVTTYLLIGLIEALLYTMLVYGTTLSLKILIKLFLSTYMIRLIITVIYSLILTFISKKKVNL